MKRLRISIIMLISVIIFCVCSVYITRKNALVLIDMLENLETVCDDNDKEKAIYLTEEIISYWESYSHTVTIFVKADKIYDAEDSLYRIIPLIKSDNDELKSEIECSKQKITWIYERELPYFRNIL